ncbi:hypothetical protein RD792_016226 [Penstemon davidsonii]|uniref:Glycosyltransferase n=1 Tax=Penstemon davidsonii TaxID=160366 RepID=A0ABR0CIZ8_9LAMI|nr:hypothetical protein RD792_016226 [Penstemon davidsonii]
MLPFSAASGHLIPALEMAKLFVSRGVKTTIITTPPFTHQIQQQAAGFHIQIQCIQIPPSLELSQTISMFQEPVEQLLKEFNPTCLIADMFFPWASDSAAKFNIPRLAFHGSCFFSVCASFNITRIFHNVSSDSEPFIIPNFPHRITFTRSQLSNNDKGIIETDFDNLVEQAVDSMSKSYGVIVNSFYDLEPEYADYYRKDMKKKAWHIGPLLLCNKQEDQNYDSHRGIDEHECLKWLDSNKANSVIYLSFGTIAQFTDSQLHEIAKGLEESGQEFIWVVKKTSTNDVNESWLPYKFEERTKNKGLIIRGWAPQRMILGHGAIGAFVTHCGWNSTLESLCAGVPMVTWPIFAEQFYNEKLIVEILRAGISVGNKIFSVVCDSVKSDAIVKALGSVMVGDDAMEMRSRVKVLKEKAMKAVEIGGSSYCDLTSLLEELSAHGSSSSK